MIGEDGIVFAPARAEHAPLLLDFFRRADAACHCRYWHFAGTTNEWLDRAANDVSANAAEMTRALGSASDEMSGIVAISGGAAVGWTKVAPVPVLAKLYSQRLYKGLPCFAGDRDRVYAVACVLVDPAARRRGVARGLLRAAVELARERGARSVEAFPRRADALGAHELAAGPFEAFLDAGFRIVHDFAPYPVLRISFE